MPTEIAFIGGSSMTVQQEASELVAKMGHPGFIQVNVKMPNGGTRQQYVCLLHAFTLVDR